jgi:hypothetical protein
MQILDFMDFFLVILLVTVLLSYWRIPLHKLCSGIIVATYYLGAFISVSYTLRTGGGLDPALIMEAPWTAVDTMIRVLGPLKSVLVGILLIAVWGLLLFLWIILLRYILPLRLPPRSRTARITILALLVIIGSFVTYHAAQRRDSLISKFLKSPIVSAYFAEPDATDGESKGAEENSIYPFVPTYSVPKPLSGENLFILQLESGNALAVEGYGKNDGKTYEGNYMPVLREFTKENGVFFPFFWGSGERTAYGIEAMLCGIIGNVQWPLALYKENQWRKPCLPELLKNRGYTTLFFGAFDSPSFDNADDFNAGIGFDEVHYTDIMEEDDLSFYWGYDDEILYKRVFDYLEEHYPNPQKLFVYIQLGVHHADFEWKDEYRSLYPFQHPATYIENFLNSYAVQDHYVKSFITRYQKYLPAGSHLFVLPDHSFPVGMNNGITDPATGATSEHFLMHLSYFPPSARREEFRIGEEIQRKYSQANLVDTIIELLSGQKRRESFAGAMQREGRQDPAYEDCQLLAQPYNGSELAVVKNQQEYYVYSLRKQTIKYYNLAKDLLTEHPKVLEEDVTLERFNDAYNCKKYWQILRSDWWPFHASLTQE